MKRIKLTVAYDGTHYSGWQIQPNAPTIEKELDTAIYALTGEKLHVTGASRTDAPPKTVQTKRLKQLIVSWCCLFNGITSPKLC